VVVRRTYLGGGVGGGREEDVLRESLSEWVWGSVVWFWPTDGWGLAWRLGWDYLSLGRGLGGVF